MNKLMRVVIIEPVGGHSGMDYYDFGLAQGLSEADVNVELHTCDETNVPINSSFTVAHTYKKIFGNAPAWQRGVRFIMGSFSALLKAKRNGSQIVHFHFFFVNVLEFFNILLSRILGLRTVITAHDVESLASGLSVPILAQWAYMMAHHVIAHSAVGKAELQHSLGIPENKISHIPIGNYFHAVKQGTDKQTARKQLGLPQSGQMVLFLGQIKEVKGLDLLLQAFAAAQQRYPEAYLVIAGRVWKDNFEKYQKLIDSLAIHDHCFTRIKFISDEDLAAYHYAADIVVLPYRRIYQSASLLMAMAYGVPVLASDIPGMQELIQDGVNSYLFESENVSSLTDRLSYALANPQDMSRIAARATNMMKVEYSWKRIGQSTADCYRYVLSH